MIRVLLIQSEQSNPQLLAEYFEKKGDKVWRAADSAHARTLLRTVRPSLIFIDMHLPGSQMLELISFIRQNYPKTRIIITNRYPDLRQEFLAKEQGVQVFLREPFTSIWIDRALKRLEESAGQAVRVSEPSLPRVRFPMRLKITIPYALLALMFTLAAAYLVSRFVVDSIDQRFTSQLIDAGQLSADWMVQEESRLLASLRAVANTSGVAETVVSGDANSLRLLALPLAANQDEDFLEILDLTGQGVLTLKRIESGVETGYEAVQGDLQLSTLDFVQAAYAEELDAGRDKYAGLAVYDGQAYFMISGPIRDGQNNIVGAVVIGRRLDRLVRLNREDTLAHVTIYGMDGSILASTLLIEQDIDPLELDLIGEVIAQQDSASRVREVALTPPDTPEPTREFAIASTDYAEILGPWEARGGEDLGVTGVALAKNTLVRPSLLTQIQAFVIMLLALLGVVAIGMLLGSQVTQQLGRVVDASSKIARGNLEVRVPSGGNDEVAVLASAFNYMVSGLQEGFIYRDILGRTVSPEVREALRLSFASGDLKLEGQNFEATVLMSDIRGFTALSEKQEPTTVLTWLNEYFGELVPVVTSYGGVVDKFEGDAMLAFFGILPQPLLPEESAFNACQAAVEMLSVIDRINARRIARNEPPLITGISINTGHLTAGGLGTTDRLNYTIIGDTVNTTQRMQEMTRRFGESGVVINETTLSALKGRRGDFSCEPLGEQNFPGKAAQLWVYRLTPRGRLKMGGV